MMRKWQDQKDMCVRKQHKAGGQDAILGNKESWTLILHNEKLTDYTYNWKIKK